MNAVQQQAMAERVATDLANAVDAWLVPKLEEILGKKTVIGIRDADFDSILLTQYQGLSLQRSHTVHDGGATYYFKLLKRDLKTAKDELLSRFKWEFNPEDYVE